MTTQRKGLTLVELVVSIVTMGMIFLIITIIFSTMTQSKVVVEREAALQSDLRTATLNVSNATRRATAVFIVTGDKYDGTVNKLTAGWSYIGVSADGKKMLHYRWDKAANDWKVEEISIASGDIEYKLRFEQPGTTYQDNKVLNFVLDGKYASSANILKSESGVLALNSNQIFDQSTPDKPGVAIAYREDPIDQEVSATVSFVFDTSGSMLRDMAGKWTSPTRLSILKNKTKLLLNDLQQIGNIRVNLITFAYNGNYYNENGTTPRNKFFDLKTEKDLITRAVDRMTANGYTNPGEGLRYAYAALRNEQASLKYVILLTDGVPNTSTRSGRRVNGQNFDLSTVGQQWPLTGRPEGNDYFIKENDDNAPRAIDYAHELTKRYSSGIKKINVIGFSGRSEDKVRGRQLTDAVAIPANGTSSQYYDASSDAELQQIFTDIKVQIAEDLWFLEGP